MDIKSFLIALKDKPLFYVMFCSDAELRPIYVRKFIEAHDGKAIYKEELQTGKQPRLIGKKPVYIVQDWEPGIKKPKTDYMKVNVPTLLLYTQKEPTETVKEVYKDRIVVIPEVTGEQATNLLSKSGLSSKIIDILKEKTSGTQEAILLGKQVISLSEELGISQQKCFDTYFLKALKDRNLDEEPTEFLQSILTKNFNYTFQYLAENTSNELFVFGCVLNWIEDIIKFCSCNGDYWNDAGLVSAKYTPFKNSNVRKIPFIQWIRIYEFGLRLMQSIKINEPDPSSVLEVFICYIIRILG